MAKIVVDPGICGFTAVVEVTRLSARRIRVVIDSDCETASGMNGDLEALDLKLALGPLEDSLVYKIAARHGGHTACPIPMAILKAIEVETGAALPQDVIIHFEATDPR